MLSSTQWELRKPLDDVLFEQMIRDLFAAHWNDPNTQVHGRRGQKQNGIDVYGQPNQVGLYFGIQCKVRINGTLTKQDISDEISEAKTFRHKLDTFIIVTTLSRDVSLQKIVEELNKTETANGGFKVQIRFWQDICALLDEHQSIINKYYGKDGHYGTSHKGHSSSGLSIVSPASPLLLGVVIDVSRSMLDLVSHLPKHTGVSQKRLTDTLNIIIEKAVAYCRTPESNEVLPNFAVFAYGYGFSPIRKQLARILSRIGVQSTSTTSEFIPSLPVRDLFAEIAEKESLPFTPNAVTLNEKWELYRSSVEAQFMDIGSAQSILYESLCVTRDRLYKELARPLFEFPVLLLITDGQLDGATDDELDAVVDEIKSMGVRIVSCYVGPYSITGSRTLYANTGKNWTHGANRLFRCSSEITSQNQKPNSIVEFLVENGWSVPNKSKLFIQLNDASLLNELADIVLTPLKIEYIHQ
ncbi:MAG: hypothetical protein R3A44_27605 [Caldilineaceae bacterium]